MKNAIVVLLATICVLVIPEASFAQNPAPLRIGQSDIQGALFEGLGRIDFFPVVEQNYEVSMLATDRFGDTEKDLLFQMLPSANTNSTTRWAVFEGWKGAGLHIGTAGFANPIVFGINQVEKMRLDANGNLGIGTPIPAYKLSVNGKVGAEEFVVVPDMPPDFVFEDDYALRSLEEVEQYIDEHGHLPEIPSAAEMQADGVGLGAMQMKLLQKIEELTLYLIEQQQQIVELKKSNARLREHLSLSNHKP